MHVSDWYPTLLNMAGVDAKDPVTIKGAVHDIDGVDMCVFVMSSDDHDHDHDHEQLCLTHTCRWPAITGSGKVANPRPVLPTTQWSLLEQQPDGTILKIILGAFQ